MRDDRQRLTSSHHIHLDDFHAVSGIARGRSGGAYTDPWTFGFWVGHRGHFQDSGAAEEIR